MKILQESRSVRIYLSSLIQTPSRYMLQLTNGDEGLMGLEEFSSK